MSIIEFLENHNDVVKLSKFEIKNLTEISLTPSICTIGKRGSGSSLLIKDIMFNNKNISTGNVISPTERMSPFYLKYLKDTNIKIKYKIHELNDTYDENIKWLILDDCMRLCSLYQRKKSINFLRSVCNKKNFVVVKLQHPYDLEIKFDYIFIFAENFTNTKKKLYNMYIKIFGNGSMTFLQFNNTFGHYTQNFKCIVIDCNNKKIFYYKAKLHDDNNFEVINKPVIKYLSKIIEI
jgi:hypothetical protein